MDKQSKTVKNVIIKNFNNTHALWFQQSKSFLLLEEPAYEVFKNYSKGIEKDNIIRICQEKYGHLEENIPQFVKEIIQHIQYYNNPENIVELSKKTSLPNNIQAKSFLPSVSYKMGDKFIEVKYETEYLKYAIHPLIAHLETNSPYKSKHIIECFAQNNLLVAKYNNKIVEAFAPENIEYFTGSIKQLMYSILYNKKYNDWMTMLHASGITANNKAILFSAAAGSGKSTISALLKAKGYGYLSDDFIAADKDGKAFPFPAAISVKEGSVKTLSEFYPELKKQETKKSFIGKTVKYIPVFNITEESIKGAKVKAFIFVKYSKTDNPVFKKIEKKEALQILLKETWVNPESEFVSAFFNWVEKTTFYKLHYSETGQALEAVQKIFEG